MRIDARDQYSSQAFSSSQEIPPPTPLLLKDGGHTPDDLPRIRIKVRGLGEGEHKIDFLTDASALDYEPFQSNVRIFGTMTKAGEQIHLKAGASAVGHFECTRCAEPFDKAIEVLLRLEFVSPRLERDPGDPNVHAFDASQNAFIDITDDVRDALALAIPMKNLCRPDCKGLCTVCGQDLNKADCGHHAEAVNESKFGSADLSALKSLGERLRREERNGGHQIGLN